MDVYDRVQRDDMVQQATVIAVFAYDAAMRDEKLPRKSLPKPAPSEDLTESKLTIYTRAGAPGTASPDSPRRVERRLDTPATL